jgi:succinate dehydrogenase/fumarate reductase flavoprotein subunit
MEVNRRDFLKGSAALVAGSALVGTLGACSPQASVAGRAEGEETTEASDIYAESHVVTTDIPDDEIIETLDYDLVVIGAGTAGTTAAFIAAEKGIGKVAILQSEDKAVSQGNMGSGLIISESDLLALLRFKEEWNLLFSHSNDKHLLENFIKYSGEAAEFVAAKAKESGFPEEYTNITDDIIDFGDVGKVVSRRVLFEPKPITYGDAMRSIATLGDKFGVDYYYNTPGVKLLTDDSGKVVAAIGKRNDGGYTRFNVTRAVILTTGCFSNNQAMLTRFCPDGLGFMPKVSNRFGDGHLMAVQVGANLRGGAYAKMVHDNDAGPMQDIPWLAVTDEGERFMNEDVNAQLWNNYAKSLPNMRFTSIFDANYAVLVEKLGGRPLTEEGIEAYIPGTEAALEKGVYADFVATYKDDTLEGLAQQIGIPADSLVKTVARYNEVVASGADTDFGKNARFLAPLDTPPYYGAHRWPRISTILSGVDVNQYMQVLDAEGNIIEGLYAAGNCGGRPAAGSGDWRQVAQGESLGFAFTGGYVAGRHAAGVLD